MDRKEAKAIYQAYRNLAQKVTEGTNVKVSSIANVLVGEEGAFVDASLWVPKSALENENEGS
jgi:hypothetical protein